MTLIGSGTITRKLVGSATLGTLSPTTTGGIEIDLLDGGDSSSSFTGASHATVQITVRKDTSANWASNNPVLGDGEFGYITDDKQLFVGDGVTAFNSLPNANFIVHLDDLDDSLSGINGSINAINEAYAVILTQLNSLDSRTDSLETASSTLSTNLSSEATTRSTADTSLQGQIDTINTSLTDGLMKKSTLQLNLSEIDVNAESNIEIIIPTPSKAVMPLHSSVLIVSDSLSAGQASIRIKSENDINIFEDLLIDDTGAFVGLTLLKIQRDPATLSGVDGKVYLYLTLGNTWAGANGVITLTILYIEV